MTVNGDLSLNGTLQTQIAGTAAFDVVDVHGHVSFGAASVGSFSLGGFSQAAGQTLELSAVRLRLPEPQQPPLPITGLGAGLTYTVTDVALGGGVYELQLNLSDAGGASVPEPGSLALLAIGGGLLARFRRRLLAA